MINVIKTLKQWHFNCYQHRDFYIDFIQIYIFLSFYCVCLYFIFYYVLSKWAVGHNVFLHNCWCSLQLQRLGTAALKNAKQKLLIFIQKYMKRTDLLWNEYRIAQKNDMQNITKIVEIPYYNIILTTGGSTWNMKVLYVW